MPLVSAATVYLLYLMGAVPFAVWAGRTAFASATARNAGGGPAGPVRPGIAATVFLVVLPLGLIAAYCWTSLDWWTGLDTEGQGDWRRIGFLALPPCAGLIAGYGIGWLLARRVPAGQIPRRP
jgi:hypothetical protein